MQVVRHTSSTPTRLLIWLLFVSCQRLFGQCWGPLMMSTHGSSGDQSLVSILRVLIETPTASIPCIYEKPNSARYTSIKILVGEAVQCVGMAVGINTIITGEKLWDRQPDVKEVCRRGWYLMDCGPWWPRIAQCSVEQERSGSPTNLANSPFTRR